MDWIPTARDSRWIATLYRGASVAHGATFQRWALDQLADRTRFSTAAWCLRRADRERLTATSTRGLSPRSLEPLLMLGAGEWLAPAAGGESGFVAQIEFAALADARPAAALLREHGFVQAFVGVFPQPDTLFSTILCLLRTAEDGGFSYADCDSLRLLLPHLAEAEALSLDIRLNLDRHLAEAGRRNRGAACLADGSGAIRALTADFRELMQRRVIGWDGVHLPRVIELGLACGGVHSKSVPALGLHVRIAASDEDLFEVHVRPAHPFDRLSAREHDIVKAIVDGESYKVAARRLGLSASTVANHASNIYRKLGALNRDQVVDLATSFRGTRPDDGE